MSLESLIWLIPAPPLLAFFLIILFANRSNKLSHSLAIGAAALSWLGSMVVFFQTIHIEELSKHPVASMIPWIPAGDSWFQIGVQIDPLSAVVLFFVAWTVLAIFIYSVGYHNYGQPKGDHDHPGLPPHGAVIVHGGKTHHVPSIEPMYARFFAFISLFAFAMYTLVVTDNLLVLYIGWEIMGLCSYLLIGFWYAKPSARDAAVKAFLTTRVGDVFMLLGLVALQSAAGTLNYQAIFQNTPLLHQLANTDAEFLGLSQAGLIGLLLFIGTVGKSAQFPLHIWLPDAMEGPTPVSAMIHAATMVSAGVYLSIRIFPLLSAGWEPGSPLTPPLMVLASIGAFTALFASSIALAQNDIKRVLAYSTIAQLGYMIAALGVGAYVAAVFHLITHAFFKALLFLGSGSVIHGMEHGALHSGDHVDVQDMFNMGGLRKRMPVTFYTFLAGGMALSGFPLITAGFWSKDEILSGAYSGGFIVVFVTLAVAALMTAFYTMRQITLTFLGKPRSQAAENAQETKWVMTLPLCVLAFFALTAGWVGIPHNFPLVGGLIPNWFEEFVGSMLVSTHAIEHEFSAIPLLTSLFVVTCGLLGGWLVYRNIPKGAVDPLSKALGSLYTTFKNKFYIDEIYQTLFIRPSYWICETLSYRIIDRGAIDGTLHLIARGALGLGKTLRSYFDAPIISGGGDVIANGVGGLGKILRRVQTGRVQQYMLVTLSVIVLFVLFSVMTLVQAGGMP